DAKVAFATVAGQITITLGWIVCRTGPTGEIELIDGCLGVLRRRNPSAEGERDTVIQQRVTGAVVADIMPKVKFPITGVGKVGNAWVPWILEAKERNPILGDAHDAAWRIGSIRQSAADLGTVPLIRAVVVAPGSVQRREARTVGAGCVL